MPNPAAVLYEAWRKELMLRAKAEHVLIEGWPASFDELPYFHQKAWWAVVGAIPKLSDPSQGAQLE